MHLSEDETFVRLPKGDFEGVIWSTPISIGMKRQYFQNDLSSLLLLTTTNLASLNKEKVLFTV